MLDLEKSVRYVCRCPTGEEKEEKSLDLEDSDASRCVAPVLAVRRCYDPASSQADSKETAIRELAVHQTQCLEAFFESETIDLV